jgi:hypothetical protein
MAFGFPAYYKITFPFIGPRQATKEAAAYAFGVLGWNYFESANGDYLVEFGGTLWSWGERLTVSFDGPDTVTVESKCVMVTQCVDWGKNKQNVKQFLAHFEGKQHRDALSPPLDPVYLDENEKTPVERIIHTADDQTPQP